MVSIRRRAKVAGDDPPVDVELNRSIEKLEDIHEELVMVDSEAMYKFLELEQNYAQIRREIYMKRNEIFKSIPNFWLTMFENHPALETLITKQDEEMLKYLLSFNVDEFRGVESGYTITFNFSSNPYFEDTNLTKTYSISHDGTVSKSDTKIKWKEGIDSANVSDHERECANRPFTEDSFISWFIEETLTNGATDEVGKIFKEDIWPDPLKYIRQEVFENEFKQKDDEISEKGGGAEEEDIKANDEEDTESSDEQDDDGAAEEEDIKAYDEQDDDGAAEEEDIKAYDEQDDGGDTEEDDEHVDIVEISDEEGDGEEDEFADLERIIDEEFCQPSEEEKDNDAADDDS